MGIHKILTAWKGRRLYLNIRKKLGFTDNDLVLFFPEDKPEEIEPAMSGVPDLLEKKQLKDVFCVWTGSEYKSADIMIKDSVILSDDQSRCLLKFYDLYNFNFNFFVVSLRLPWSRQAYRLEGFKDLTRKDLYRYMVFGI